ncbi:J domain-containing protein [[Candida] zeylanoides]
MSFSKDQEQIVLKTLSYKSHQYYEVLSVHKTASETEIKKSYRKLAIKLHPDKNPHPRSSEAFKLLNKAWGVLSDPNKKQIYDQTGVDPDARGASAGGGGGGGFATRGAAGASPFQGFQGGGFEDDIFNLFFGGGGGGARPGAGPAFTFGNNGGFTFHSFGGGDGAQFFQTNPRQRRQQPQRRTRPPGSGVSDDEEPSLLATLRLLFPILLFLLVPILSALFSDTTPEYSFTATRKFNTPRTTPNYHIQFFVPENFANSKDMSPTKLRNFDRKVENLYIQDKRSKCSREQVRKNELMEDAEGWFFTDQVKLEQAQRMPMPNCEILRGMNLI